MSNFVSEVARPISIPSTETGNGRKPTDSIHWVPEPLLDTEEAAAIMKIHPRTLQRYAREGRIHGLHVGKLWRFRASVIGEWIERQMAS